MALLTETTKQLGDLLIWEAHPLHAREQCVIVNPVAAIRADQNLFGLPVANITRVGDNHWSAELVLAAGVAGVEGVILKNETITIGASATTTAKYNTLVRGPAVLNKNWIRATDPAGAAYDLNAIAAALGALGIVVRAEPVQAISW